MLLFATACSFVGSTSLVGGSDGGPHANADAMRDGHTIDGKPIDADTTGTCASVDGLLAGMCASPTSDTSIPGGSFDTGTGNSMCSPEVTMLCVVEGKNITVNNEVTVSGTRPLVLFASGTIMVSGGLDVSSTLTTVGAGGDSSECLAFASTPDASTEGAGAGAGASFGTVGANGGDGNKNGVTHAGGGAAGAAAALTHVRGGCQGQGGAAGSDSGPNGGHGGGALYLFAATSITSSGNLFASGGGGGGGDVEDGGGGGGAGGLIGLEAPTITSSGRIAANGGGGGGGGGLSAGTGGVDGTTTNPMQAATGGAGGDMGGVGGNGGAIDIAPGTTAIENGGGGGGGGGLGILWVLGTFTPGSQTSPAPTQ